MVCGVNIFLKLECTFCLCFLLMQATRQFFCLIGAQLSYISGSNPVNQHKCLSIAMCQHLVHAPLAAYGLEFRFIVAQVAGSVGETVGEQSYFFDDAERILGSSALPE